MSGGRLTRQEVIKFAASVHGIRVRAAEHARKRMDVSCGLAHELGGLEALIEDLVRRLAGEEAALEVRAAFEQKIELPAEVTP